MRYLFAAILAFATACSSQAAPEAQFADAVKTFQQARDGQDSQIEPAIAAFEALAKAAPAQPLFAAYLGCGLRFVHCGRRRFRCRRSGGYRAGRP